VGYGARTPPVSRMNENFGFQGFLGLSPPPPDKFLNTPLAGCYLKSLEMVI